MTRRHSLSRRAVLRAGLSVPAAATAVWSLGAGPALADTDRLVGSVPELEQAFADVPDGGRILLAPGDYGRARLRGRDFARGVTLTSADPAQRAVFTRNLVLETIAGMTVTGLAFRTGGFFEHSNRYDKIQLVLRDCRRVVIADSSFVGYIPTAAEGIDPEAPDLRRGDALAGYARDKGLQLEGCADIVMEGLRMADLRIGLGCNTSQRISLRGLEIARAREGINFNDASDLSISDSHFHSFRPWLAKASPRRDHPDMIQYWATPRQIGIHRITIHRNLFHQRPGQSWTQTVFGQMRAVPGKPSPAREIRVTGNTIINSHLHGISIHDAETVMIADNLLLPTSDQPDQPRQVKMPTISLMGSRDVDVTRNTLLPYGGDKRPDRPIRTEKGALRDGRVRWARDNRLLSTRPVSPYFWRRMPQDVPSPAAAYRAARGWDTPLPGKG